MTMQIAKQTIKQEPQPHHTVALRGRVPFNTGMSVVPANQPGGAIQERVQVVVGWYNPCFLWVAALRIYEAQRSVKAGPR